MASKVKAPGEGPKAFPDGEKAPDGVHVIVRRSTHTGEPYFLARWTDPQTGKRASQVLDKLGCNTPKRRLDWCKRRSAALQAERLGLSHGAIPSRPSDASRLTPADAVTGFLSRLEAEGKRPATVKAYKSVLSNVFLAWAKGYGLATLSRLDVRALASLRDHVVGMTRKAPLANPTDREGKALARVGKGARKATDVPASAEARNHAIRHLKGFLNEARRRALTPALDRDAISDALRMLRSDMTERRVLTAPDVVALLGAALKHDEERVPSVAPAVALFVLAGLRKSEALSLTWEDVDFAHDRIVVRGEATNTTRTREVPFRAVPGLRSMLERLALRRGKSPSVLSMTDGELRAALRRLTEHEGPDGVSPQVLRRTAGSAHVCSGVHGEASLFIVARMLGHGTAVSERYYLRAMALPLGCVSVEDALNISDKLGRIAPATAPRAKGGRDAPATAQAS